MYITKTVSKTIGKILMKGIALILLVLLTIFNAALKAILFVYHFIAVPMAVVAIAIAGFTYHKIGFDPNQVWLVAGAVIAVVLYYLLPILPGILEHTKDNMKDFIFEPLFIRSPVKYTM